MQILKIRFPNNLTNPITAVLSIVCVLCEWLSWGIKLNKANSR
jgi:hypothetical protein